MKYKAGDKVRIKTWEQMEKEFGLDGEEDIECDRCFTKEMEEELKELDTDRVVTIKMRCCPWQQILADYYLIKESESCWSEGIIECLANKEEKNEPIYDRFEILDL